MTVHLDSKVRAAIATIDDDAWTPIKYTDVIFDQATNTWVSKAEVAEIPFTAFSSRKASEQVHGHLVVRRIPDLNTADHGQQTPFDTWRFHAFFTTTDTDLLDTVDAGKTHRVRRQLITTPARIASSARQLKLHLPTGWPWQHPWTELFTQTCGPPKTATS